MQRMMVVSGARNNGRLELMLTELATRINKVVGEERVELVLHVPVDRKALAYALSTHLCYTGIQPHDKAIDVILRRYESFTPERERERQADLAERWSEYEANR